MKHMGYLGISLITAFPYLFTTVSVADDLAVAVEHGQASKDTGARPQGVSASKGNPTKASNGPLPGDVCLFSSFNGNEIQARECGSGYFSAQGPEQVLGVDERQHALRSSVQVERGRSEVASVSESKLADRTTAHSA